MGPRDAQRQDRVRKVQREGRGPGKVRGQAAKLRLGRGAGERQAEREGRAGPKAPERGSPRFQRALRCLPHREPGALSEG